MVPPQPNDATVSSRPRPAGPSTSALIRLIAVILLLGVVSNFSSQISVANDSIFANISHGKPDDFAVHLAGEKASQVDRLEAEITKLLEELDKAKVGESSENAVDSVTESSQRTDGVCGLISEPVPSASFIWNHHLADIHKAIKHPQDVEDAFHDLTASLLHILTPVRLEKSVLAPPMDYAHVGQVLDVAYKRYKFIRDNTKGSMEFKQLDDANVPRPVNIMVMGGSVAMGVMCRENPVTNQGLNRYSRRGCAWSARLEAFVNRVAKADIIRVQTVTLGGTNTESGQTIWKYGLYPDDYPHPDILINAYSTNDVHVNSEAAAKAQNKTLYDAVWDLTQQFIRTSKAGCKPPLLIYFDDYIGNEQNGILETTRLSQTIHLLSQYYGTMAISYATAVRDLVYRGTEEAWFSPSNWFEGKEKKWSRQVHPGMGMHFSSALVIAFNFLHLLTTYCSLHPSERDTAEIKEQSDGGAGNWDYGYKSINGLPELRNGPVPKGPKPPINALPPWLDQDLKLETITARWNEDAAKSATMPDQANCKPRRPCLFSFVSGLEKDINKPKVLTGRIKPYLSENKGWEAQDDHGKTGWAPTGGLGSKFTLEFKDLSQPIKILTFMVMKSYGERWEGSNIRIRAYFKDRSSDAYALLGDSLEIEGEHGKNTSETYNHELTLSDSNRAEGAATGGSLKVEVELVGGTTAKIMGLAFCDVLS